MLSKTYLTLLLLVGLIAYNVQGQTDAATLILDKITIAELISQYAKNTDAGNTESSVNMFVENGALSSPLGTVSGHEELRKQLERISSTTAKGKRHIMTNITSEINGDKATATSYMTVVDAENSTNIILTGIYYDKLIKEENMWKFKERYLGIDPSFNMKKDLISEIKGDANAKVIVLFGGNPHRRDEVLRNLSILDNVTIYGTLSEEEGIAKIEELNQKVDLVVIGGRYTDEQRTRIKEWLKTNMPDAKITEPGVDYSYSNDAIISNIQAKLEN